MNKPHTPPGRVAPTLAERLAPMTIAEIDAMSDQQVAELMGATAEETAEDPWSWRMAAKIATDEYLEPLVIAVESGRETVIAHPAEMRQRLGILDAPLAHAPRTASLGT